MARPADKATATWVVRQLREAGFQALFAGGCVRDMLLGIRCNDYDIATDAVPDQVRALFRRVLLVGAKFGVTMVLHRGRKVEVTTFRSDLSYSDGRRPDGVRFSTPEEDARRRDFTINGMFYDPLDGRVIDFVGGRDDLRRRVLRTIGRADERFAEDYLRMLRAVRFSVRFGLRMDGGTARAVRRHAASIARISGERVFDELSKMITHPAAGRALELLAELGLARHVLPELFDPPELWARAADCAGKLARRGDLPLTLGAMMLELDARAISRRLRAWGASNDLRDAICWLAVRREGWRTAADARLCEFKRLQAGEHFRRLRTIWAIVERRETGGLTQARRIARRAGQIAPETINPPPLLTGEDLKRQIGLSEGKRLGRVLAELRDRQLDEEISTPREALELARRLVQGAD